MTEIIDTVGGWTLEEGDFVILFDKEDNRHEAEIRTLLDGEAEIYSHTTGDVLTVPLDLDTDYDIWGE